MLWQMKCDDVTVSINVKERVTVIRGDSGLCKTYFVDKLFDNDSCVERVTPILFARLPMQALNMITTTKDVMFIVDDELFFTNRKLRRQFQDYVQKFAVENNLYFLIIERSVVELKSLSYSIYSISEMVEVEENHYVNVPLDTQDV